MKNVLQLGGSNLTSYRKRINQLKDGICIKCNKLKKIYAKNICRVCYYKEQNDNWKKRNPEKVKKYKEKTNKKLLSKGYFKDYCLRKNYGIGIETFNKLHKEQDGGCAICGKSNESLGVDHNHITGKIRGLLCKGCNLIIGIIEDRPELFLNINSYLNYYNNER